MSRSSKKRSSRKKPSQEHHPPIQASKERTVQEKCSDLIKPGQPLDKRYPCLSVDVDTDKLKSMTKDELTLAKLRLDVQRQTVGLLNDKLDLAEREATNWAARVYVFDEGVNQSSVRACVNQLGEWARLTPGCPITILLNSPGGSCSSGFQLYDYLRALSSLGHYITTYALGTAASMGSVVLQAGDRRIIGANAMVMVHQVSSGINSQTPYIEDQVKYHKMIEERMMRIYVSRSKLTEQQIRGKWDRRDWYMLAEEAVEFGFADEIG